MRHPFTRLSDGDALPRAAYGDPAASARALAAQIPVAIAQAEALGAVEVVGHLRMALEVAQRLAADGQSGRPFGGGPSC